MGKEITIRPATVSLVEKKPDLSLIAQSAYYVDNKNKFNLLSFLLKNEPVENALVFVRTKQNAEDLCDKLLNLGLNAVSLHGNKEQDERSKALNDF